MQWRLRSDLRSADDAIKTQKRTKLGNFGRKQNMSQNLAILGENKIYSQADKTWQFLDKLK
jgi:hypothetical protein